MTGVEVFPTKQKSMGKPCKHVHVSGRRCGIRILGKDLLTGKPRTYCRLHQKEYHNGSTNPRQEADFCTECHAMKVAFNLA